MNNEFLSKSLLESLLSNDFPITYEVVTKKGNREDNQHVIDRAKAVAEGNLNCTLSLTDSPGGKENFPPYAIAMDIKKLGISPLVHIACRNKTRDYVKDILNVMKHQNIKDILALSGDYGLLETEEKGSKKPVFDIDSVQLTVIAKEIGDFNVAVGMNPYKYEEGEVFAQYNKLYKKILAGADYVIMQIGYDLKKARELQRFIGEMEKEFSRKIPLMANIFLATDKTANYMYNDNIPGVRMPEYIANKIRKECEGKTKEESIDLAIERAAKEYAVYKGMGFSGVHIGGTLLNYNRLTQVVEKGEEYYKNWEEIDLGYEPVNDGFYLYENVPKTRKEIKANNLVSKNQKFSRLLGIKDGLSIKIYYGFRDFFGTKSPKKYKFERWSKVHLYDCRDCGDCALPEIGYLCPMSYCPKHERNGACGGSKDGYCEVYTTNLCIYVRSYYYHKYYNEEMNKIIIPPRDISLQETSSWYNFCEGLDHRKGKNQKHKK